MVKTEMVKRVQFDGVEFTVVNWNGEWCYVDFEVCDYLEYKNMSDALATKIKDENGKVKVGRKEWNEFIEKLNSESRVSFEVKQRGLYLITEDGMYDLMYNSEKENAKEFRKWIKSTLKSIRQDYGLNAWEIINMMSVEDSKILKAEYQDICDDLGIGSNVPHMYVDVLKLLGNYYGYEYTKGINIEELRKTKYPNILQDRKKIGDLYLRYFAMSGSHKVAFDKTLIKLNIEKQKYIAI